MAIEDHETVELAQDESEPVESSPESRPGRGRMLVLVIAFIALAGGATVGGYFLGDTTGADLDAARAEGAAAGEKAGTAEGAKEGYADGLKQGREEGYEETYADAYREAYADAYEAAELDPPKDIEVSQ